MNGSQDRRPRHNIPTTLIRIAKVDDRANAVIHHGSPARRGQPVQSVTANDRARAREPTVDSPQPTEIASVETAIPLQAARDAVRHRPSVVQKLSISNSLPPVSAATLPNTIRSPVSGLAIS